MPKNQEQPSPKLTKGERTATRILDVAEDLFARHGYEGTSLRQIAEGAGLREPGLYNHFSSKQGLYEAVLYRALNPMAEAMAEQLNRASGLRDYTDLPSAMTDLLLEHPQMAALFQQALQGTDSPGQELMRTWLDRLLAQGLDTARSRTSHPVDRAELALEVVAADAVYPLRPLVDVALGIEEPVVLAPGQAAVNEFDAADLDDAMSLRGGQAGRFGVEDDLSH